MTDIQKQPVLSAIGTVANNLPNLEIKDGQLIFVHDRQTIALDFKGKRKFYNQIVTLQTEQERQELLAPIFGSYYFVVSTCILWYYQSKWIQVTEKPREILVIDKELPELGVEKTLYVNSKEQNISIWDSASNSFIKVGSAVTAITNDEISSLF